MTSSLNKFMSNEQISIKPLIKRLFLLSQQRSIALSLMNFVLHIHDFFKDRQIDLFLKRFISFKIAVSRYT